MLKLLFSFFSWYTNTPLILLIKIDKQINKDKRFSGPIEQKQGNTILTKNLIDILLDIMLPPDLALALALPTMLLRQKDLLF